MTDPKVIWLSPQCPIPGVPAARSGGINHPLCEHPDAIFADVGGRMWCEDCVWSACPACGAKPVRYTLSEEGGG